MSVAPDVRALYEQHDLLLVRLARNLVDDLPTAEDVVQDVFAALPGKAIGDDPLRYLQRAVVNRSRSALRRRRVVRAFLSRATVADDAEPADGDALRADRRRAVLGAVDALPRRQREIVVLRFYEDLGVTEIADLLGVTPGAVSSSLARALDSLHARIGARDEY